MVALFLNASTDPFRASLRQRGVAIAVTVAVHVGLLLLLLWMAPEVFAPERPAPNTFRLLPIGDGAEEVERPAPTPKPASGAAARAETEPRPTPPEPEPEPPPPPTPPTLNYIPVSRSDLASLNGALASRGTAPAAGASAGQGTAGNGRERGDEDGGGTGPGGERLYDPDWQRRPSSAELAFYTPKSAPRPGWGLIACRTAERFAVEDCRVLAESPQGSGYGRAVQAAAWQFRVRPPRVGGRPLIGAWVRIRIDYTEAGAEPRGR